MKKYKLIKKLPFEGSPDIGYISTETMVKDGAHYWNHNWFHPEDYPEFWEEVIEKPELCVPVGTRFTMITFSILPDVIYTIDSKCDDKVRVSWIDGQDTYINDWTIESVNKYFQHGIWKIYTPALNAEDGLKIVKLLVNLNSFLAKKLLKK